MRNKRVVQSTFPLIARMSPTGEYTIHHIKILKKYGEVCDIYILLQEVFVNILMRPELYECKSTEIKKQF